MKNFYIDKFLVGQNCPPLFLPDIGTFFNQDIDTALRLIDRIKEAGAQIVKGEILHSADIALKSDAIESYLSNDNEIIKENYRELIERKIVSFGDYEKIFNYCKDIQIPFVVSVYDIDGAEFAKKNGAAAIKIASSNIVHAPLIRHVANLGVPIILDTGKSTLEEITRAVQWVKDVGCQHFIVEHSPVPPPSALSEHNLRMLRTLKVLFDCPIGLSDHHAGEEMLYAATALGVNVLEKGLCDDDARSEQDVFHALPSCKLQEVLTKCRNIFQALGAPVRSLPIKKGNSSARMGLVTKRLVKQGELIDLETVTFAFPARGIAVENWDLVHGWRFQVDLPANTIINWANVAALPA